MADNSITAPREICIIITSKPFFCEIPLAPSKILVGTKRSAATASKRVVRVNGSLLVMMRKYNESKFHYTLFCNSQTRHMGGDSWGRGTRARRPTGIFTFSQIFNIFAQLKARKDSIIA